jgi:hypothetical protein
VGLDVLTATSEAQHVARGREPRLLIGSDPTGPAFSIVSDCHLCRASTEQGDRVKTRGFEVLEWSQRFLPSTSARSQPLVLSDEQARFVSP